MSWSKSFADPTELPNGRVLRTLRDAGHYVTSLRKADQLKSHWQTAAHELMIAAECGGILMLAEIATRQALAPMADRCPHRYRGRKEGREENTGLSDDAQPKPRGGRTHAFPAAGVVAQGQQTISRTLCASCQFFRGGLDCSKPLGKRTGQRIRSCPEASRRAGAQSQILQTRGKSDT